MAEMKNGPKLVDLFVPRGSANEEPNLQIGINGVNYLLPRGKTSKVPDFVAEEYKRSQEAQVHLDDTVADLIEKSKQPMTL